MITPPYLRTMTAYNAEMNRRWYTAAETLTDAQRREDRGAFFGSLHATLSHLLWADTIWMSRFAGWPKPAVPWPYGPSMSAGWSELTSARFDLDARLIAWAGTITQDWLDADLTWFSGGLQKDMVNPCALLVTHMFNHQAHHRGQAHAILTSFGAKTGDTDLPFVL